MNTLLDEQEELVRDSAREFLAGESTPALVRQAEQHPSRYSQALWQQFAELGWLGVSLPQACGGQGLPLSYMGLVFEELGRHLAPLPVHATVVPALVIARHGTPEQQQALLPPVAAGTALLSWAVAEQDGRWDKAAIAMTARREGRELVLDGSKHFVDHFGNSRRCLVAVRLDGTPRLVLVDTGAAGISAEELVPMAKDRQDLVRFAGVRVPQDRLVGSGAAAVDDLMDLAAVFYAAQMEGAARKAMEISAAYVNEREAFGQPIGAFQAIQHLAADMLNAVDGTQLLTREAVWRLGNDLPARVEVAQAKSFANTKCQLVVRGCQQFHGGSGFIAETDINLWYRRVTSWALRGGTTHEHRRLIAAALLDLPGRVRLGMTQRLPEPA
jgi:alkylation response protein AidB-like acyl-CoA dehydrogenase